MFIKMRFNYYLNFLLLVMVSLARTKDEEKCDRVKSTLKIEYITDEQFLATHEVTVLHQMTECRKCNLIPLTQLAKDPTANRYYALNELDAHFDYYFKVMALNSQTGLESVVCEQFKYTKFGECGKFLFNITNDCSISVTKQPNNIYIGLYTGIPCIILIILLFNLVEKYYENIRDYVNSVIQRSIFSEHREKVAPIDELNEIKAERQKTNTMTNQKPTPTPTPTAKTKSSTRYGSLDAFRGLSVILMIFVQNGYFTYKFNYHVPWYGFNLSSLVMPWFIWIMGASVPIALNLVLRKPNVNKYRVFLKILWRSVKLFAIGLWLNIDYEWSFHTIRYFGVLQRIALCYFVLAFIELIFWKKINPEEYKNTWKYHIQDLIYAIPHSIAVSVILFVWFMIVYLLPVPGCPKGYMGPGGLDDGGKYFNCTGGATGYIDELLMGESHLYIYPTQMQIYKTVKNYEPEGILGTLPSIVLAYFGVIAGRVLLMYQNRLRHLITYVIWSLVTFVVFGALTQFNMEDGTIPVIKNTWTITFTLIGASTAFLILAICYFIIDFKHWWNGKPFIYAGCNSLFVYVGHYLVAFRFPYQWYTEQLCTKKMFMCIWGSTIWFTATAYLYWKKIFFNL